MRESFEPVGQWVSAAQLALPVNFPEICKCSPEQLEKGHAALTAASQKLAEYYEHMGEGETSTFKFRLLFATSMLLEQTSGHKRDMVQQIRDLHKLKPYFPSVATIYRIVAPLKVWLAKKSGLDRPPTVGELRADSKPLLLLTAENLQEIVTDCKTSRKFAKDYRPRRRGATGHLPDDQQQPDPAKSTANAKPITFLIHGPMTADQRDKIATILHQGCQFCVLDENQAATASKWLTDGTKKG